jgi:hypothetical protein
MRYSFLKGEYFNYRLAANAPPAAAVRGLLVVCFLFLIVYRFVDCLPPETARIARLTAR